MRCAPAAPRICAWGCWWLCPQLPSLTLAHAAHSSQGHAAFADRLTTGTLTLPSGETRNLRAIDTAYVFPGVPLSVCVCVFGGARAVARQAPIAACAVTLPACLPTPTRPTHLSR